MTLADTPWNEAMDWLKAPPSTWYVLADPGHAWKYGVSVRLAAEKDTLLEAGKDTALAMYDRRMAMAVADRLAALRGLRSADDAELRALRRTVRRGRRDRGRVEAPVPAGACIATANS